MRIRQEGDDHPQYGVAAEEKLKILLSEANLSSLSSTSNSSKVSRTRQKISEMKTMETQLEEQGKVEAPLASPVKGESSRSAPSQAYVAASVKVPNASNSGHQHSKRAPPTDDDTDNTSQAKAKQQHIPHGKNDKNSPDKWSTDILPGTVIYMKAPVTEKEFPTKQEAFASKLPNFTSSFLGKAIDLDTAGTTATTRKPTPVVQAVESPAVPGVKKEQDISKPSAAPPSESPTVSNAPRTLQGRRPPPPAVEPPPLSQPHPVGLTPAMDIDNGLSPPELAAEDAYFQEADEVDTTKICIDQRQQKQYQKPPQARAPPPSNNTAGSREQPGHGGGPDSSYGDDVYDAGEDGEAEDEKGSERDDDEEETGEFVPDDLLGYQDGSGKYSEGGDDYDRVYGMRRRIDTAEDDDDLEELAGSPTRSSKSNSIRGEHPAGSTAFPFPDSSAQSPDLTEQSHLQHRMYSIDENEVSGSDNASSDVTPVRDKNEGSNVEKNIKFTSIEGSRTAPLETAPLEQDELKFTLPRGLDNDEEAGAGDGDGEGDHEEVSEGVGEDGLDEEAEREADEKAQIRTLRSHAKVLEGLNDIAAAEGVHMRALELDPTNITTLEGFAQFLHQKKGELARAEAFFNRGLQVCLPGLCLKGTGSANSTPQSNRKTPHNMSFATDSTMQGNKVKHIIKFILSYAHFMSKSKGDIEAASILYKKGLDLAPDNAFLLATYAHFLAQVGDKESMAAAMEYFQKALKLSPGNAQFCMWYGKLLKRLGKMGQAELMYKVALEQTKGNSSLEPTAICNYATFIFKQRKDPERAIALFRAGLQSYSGHKGLRKNYATVVKAHPQLASAEGQPEAPSRRSQGSSSGHREAAGRAERLAQQALDSIRDDSPVESTQEEEYQAVQNPVEQS